MSGKPVTDRGHCLLCGQDFIDHEAFKSEGVTEWYCTPDDGPAIGRYTPKVSDSELEESGQLNALEADDV